jgi:hypothetical protein
LLLHIDMFLSWAVDLSTCSDTRKKSLLWQQASS